MEHNISLNNLQSNVTAMELDWSVCRRLPLRTYTRLQFLKYLIIARAKPVPELQRPDIVLAADCVYFEPAFPLLVSTLAMLVPPPPERAPEVLFCYKKRRKADKRFFALLKKYFTWNIVRGRELRICPNSCALTLKVDDDPAQDNYSREAITLLRLSRRG